MHIQQLQIQKRELQESLRTYANSLYITDTQVVTRDGISFLYATNQNTSVSDYFTSFAKWTLSSNAESQQAITNFINRHIAVLQSTHEKPFPLVSYEELDLAEQNEQLLQRIIAVSKDKFAIKYGPLPHYSNKLQEKIADCIEAIAHDRGVASLIPAMKEGVYLADERLVVVCEVAIKAARFASSPLNQCWAYKRVQAIAKAHRLTRVIDERLTPLYPKSVPPRAIQLQQEIKRFSTDKRRLNFMRLSDELIAIESFSKLFTPLRRRLGVFRAANRLQLKDLHSDLWQSIFSFVKGDIVRKIELIGKARNTHQDILNIFNAIPHLTSTANKESNQFQLLIRCTAETESLTTLSAPGVRFSEENVATFLMLETKISALYQELDKKGLLPLELMINQLATKIRLQIDVKYF